MLGHVTNIAESLFKSKIFKGGEATFWMVSLPSVLLRSEVSYPGVAQVVKPLRPLASDLE